MHAVAALGKNEAADAAWSFAHIRVGRIVAEERVSDGISGDIAAIRRLYSKTVATAEAIWESVATEGQPDLPGALQAVEGLADAVTQNRTALVALTAMRNYDNYTFTHMVNVSILTMGQARALGIDGKLLREFGLSALMHDIGKVRTPKEILNKPDKLTDDEFVIMRRIPIGRACGFCSARTAPGSISLTSAICGSHAPRASSSTASCVQSIPPSIGSTHSTSSSRPLRE